MRTSIGWPITLGVVMIVLVVALIVGWVTVTVIGTERSAAYWALLAVGTTFLVLVLVGVVLYLLISVKEIRLNARQSNFIDSVTHELKSPIASLKLYLQTLSRRNVDEQRQADFYRFMLEDVDRLDSLINHLLDAARLDQQPVEADVSDVELAEMLKNCAETICARYHLPADTVQLRLEPAIVRGRPIDLEMIFRNLIDNAIKYSGDTPRVEIESLPRGPRNDRNADHRQRARHSGRAAAQDFRPFRTIGERARTLADRHRTGAVHRPQPGQAAERPGLGPRPRRPARDGVRSAVAGPPPGNPGWRPV